MAGGFALRFHGLGQESLWLDEGFSRTLAMLPLPELLGYARTADNNPPLHGLLLHALLPLLGDSEAALRLVSALCGGLAVLVIYRLGSRLYDRDTGLVAAALLATAAFHVGYSQEARPYSLMALLSLLSMDVYAAGLDAPRRREAVLYLLWGALLLYSHSYGGFTLLAQTLHAAVLRRDRLGRLLALQAGLLLAFLPWLGVVFQQVSALRHGFWLTLPSISTLAESFEAFAGSRALLGILVVAAAVGLIDRGMPEAGGRIAMRPYRIRLRVRPGSALLGIWMLTPIGAPFLVSHGLTPVYHTRYAIAASLPLYLLAAAGLRKLRPPAIRAAVCAAALVLGLYNVYGIHSRTDKEQWREAAALLDAEARPGELALFDAGFCLRHAFSYYARGQQYETRPFPAEKKPVAAEALPELDAMARDRAGLWLVLSHRRDREGIVRRRLLERGWHGTGHWNLVGIEIYRFAPGP